MISAKSPFSHRVRLFTTLYVNCQTAHVLSPHGIFKRQTFVGRHYNWTLKADTVAFYARIRRLQVYVKVYKWEKKLVTSGAKLNLFAVLWYGKYSQLRVEHRRVVLNRPNAGLTRHQLLIRFLKHKATGRLASLIGWHVTDSLVQNPQ